MSADWKRYIVGFILKTTKPVCNLFLCPSDYTDYLTLSNNSYKKHIGCH